MSDESDIQPSVICVGSSAGGLEALTALIGALEPGLQVPIIVAQHLAPTHRSLLSSLMQKASKLPVDEIVDGQEILPGHVMITPEGSDAIIEGGRIKLVSALGQPGPHPSVNRLFSSAAEQFGKRTVGIVLSGTGSDGTLGAGRIDAVGGAILVQDEETAKYWSMPRSVINAGLATVVAPPESLARQAVTYLELGAVGYQPKEGASEEPFQTIVDIVERRLGFQLSNYKPASVMRRIGARMSAKGCRTLESYASILQSDADEAASLVQALLIPVTSFFRDDAAFAHLKTQLRDQIPIVTEKTGQFRVWVTACCTGEEAYSIAILIDEICKELNVSPNISIFATDLSESFVETARKGVYPADRLVDVPSDRIEAYFDKIASGYRVAQRIRDTIVFASHDILRSTPFLHLDLISCRNILIYFQPSAQKTALRTIYNALEPNGLLFLGRSEALGDSSTLFEEVSRENHIFRKSSDAAGLSPSISRPFARAKALAPYSQRPSHRARAYSHQDLLVDTIVQLSPPTFLVNRDDVVENIVGDTRSFVTISNGPQSGILYDFIPDELELQTRIVLAEARRSGAERMSPAVRIAGQQQHDELWKVEARPVKSDIATDLLLVRYVKQELAKDLPIRSDSSLPLEMGSDDIAVELQRELAETRAQLRTVIEELEIANEELQAANEELLSSNEEFQATNEELETTNEELQATNEELETVNDELTSKNRETAKLYDDLSGVLESIKSPIFIFGPDDVFQMANSAAERISRVIGVDEEHLSLGHFLGLINEPKVLSYFKRSIKSDKPIGAVKVKLDQKQYELEMSVWRDAKRGNRVLSKVIVFHDVTKLLKAQDEIQGQLDKLRLLEFRQRAILDGVDESLALVDQTGAIVAINSNWSEVSTESDSDLSGLAVGTNLITALESLEKPDLTALRPLAPLLRGAIESPVYRETHEFSRAEKAGDRWYRYTVSSFHEDGACFAVVLRSDISEQKRNIKLVGEALHEKEVLIQEIHHRVKNNFQVILSILSLQNRAGLGPADLEQLSESSRRIRVMSKLYEHLYQSQDVSMINVQEYFADVLDDAMSAAGAGDGISSEIDCDRIPLGIKTATALAQILSELVSNAVKHAFPQREGRISITLRKQADEAFCLAVQDNGLGLPADYDESKLKSMGIKLINALVSQLKATKRLTSGNGTRVEIVFKEQGE